MRRITKLLVANRGEIARRIFRTAHEMGIRTVAVYANPDARAPFVTEACEAVALGGNTSAESYLDVAKVIEAARRSGADAIHPGYGFLSENAAFARAVMDAGMAWIGPHAEAIAAMGDKLAAKKLMHEAGVPTLESIEVLGDVDDALIARIEQLAFPVLVKATGGGGGKGMRIVPESGKLKNAISAARREAKNHFGDDRVFVERYLEGVRHVEVQVFGDQHGNVAHLFERECSIQRRHQKIIEESPSPAVSAELRERMGAEAVAAARAIGYDNAGTVEFILDRRGHFYFLEVNTRLQVEHPVTEAITGRDLVREQIRVAEGEPLSFSQHDLHVDGHAIEARLYAENPAKDFFPVPGTILQWSPAASPALRIDSGVETGSEVSVYFDPMLAKVIAHAPTRLEASLSLALGLERLGVIGLQTNREFLVDILRSESFLEGDTTTDFIERVNPPRSRDVPQSARDTAAVAAALAGRDPGGESGTMKFDIGGVPTELAFAHGETGELGVMVNGSAMGTKHFATDGNVLDLEVGGLRRRVQVIEHEGRWHTHDGAFELTVGEAG